MVIFAIFFALGVWLLQQQAALPDFAWAWLLLSFPFALLFSFSFLPRRTVVVHSARTLLIAAFGCGLGFYHAAWQAEQRLAVSLPDEWEGRDIDVIGVVAELPHRYEQGLRFSFDVEQIVTPQASVPKHIYLSTYFDQQSKPLELKAGGRWRLTLRLKQPHGSSNPHGFDFRIVGAGKQCACGRLCKQQGQQSRLDDLSDTRSGFRLSHRIMARSGARQVQRRRSAMRLMPAS